MKKKTNFKKIFEIILVFLISISFIEMSSAILSALTYESLIDSKILVVEVMISLVLAYVYYKSAKK